MSFFASATEAVTVGCASNSDCPTTESCINQLCVTPCNCGPNAECKVTNHYAICYCKKGYSGNPQHGCVKLGCESDSQCPYDKQCFNGECLNPCIIEDPCATNAICFGSNHHSQCKCPSGYDGNPFAKCERVECRSNNDCPSNKACLNHQCVNPCAINANPPCASNAMCYVHNHAAACRCPDHLPEGNPLEYCERTPLRPSEPECRVDTDCPNRLACIKNECVDPCSILKPCSDTAMCGVLNSIPVRTMVCTCAEGWVPNTEGECTPGKCLFCYDV